MNENEYRFAKNIVNLDKNINEAIEYIYNNFGVNCEYDENNHIMNLTVFNINEGAQLLAANEYIKQKFGDYLITNIS